MHVKAYLYASRHMYMCAYIVYMIYYFNYCKKMSFKITVAFSCTRLINMITS